MSPPGLHSRSFDGDTQEGLALGNNSAACETSEDKEDDESLRECDLSEWFNIPVQKFDFGYSSH